MNLHPQVTMRLYGHCQQKFGECRLKLKGLSTSITFQWTNSFLQLVDRKTLSMILVERWGFQYFQWPFINTLLNQKITSAFDLPLWPNISTMHDKKTRNLLIWIQTCYHCATNPITIKQSQPSDCVPHNIPLLSSKPVLIFVLPRQI